MTARSNTTRGVGIAAGLVLVVLAASAVAQPAAPDPDWPCIQRLLPEIAPGMVWSGPPLDGGEVPDDPAREALASELARRATAVDHIEGAVASFADDLPAETREAQLTHLFHAALERINAERDELIAAIKRYARGQRRLADKIADDNRRLAGYRVDVTPGTQPELEALRVERDWDLRVFDDRQTMLQQVCEQPVHLEQRAFALARIIQTHLAAP